MIDLNTLGRQIVDLNALGRQIVQKIDRRNQTPPQQPSTRIAVQDDGTVITNNHRVLNFQGAGVVLSDDPTMRRTNILIAGSALVSTATQLVISTIAAKALSLWNGSSNNAVPANWQTTGFNDSGWAAAVASTGANATTIAGATKDWSAATPAAITEITLIRHTFTVPTGTYQSISLTIEADNYVDAVYLNGTLLGSATNGVPGTSQSKTTLPITPGLLIMGTNVLAIQGRNSDPGPGVSAAWVAYVINSTLVTSAPTTSNTFSVNLSGNVTMTTANTYYDGPSVSLGIGTWLVMAAVDCGNESTGAGQVGAKLWDGTTVFKTAEVGTSATAGAYVTAFVSAIVTLGATTTVKVSGATQQNGSIMRASLRVNGAGNNCTYIQAVQIA